MNIMKNIKSIIAILLLAFVMSCDVEYYDTPNAPSEPPTAAVLNNSFKAMVDDFYDQWFGGRFTQVTMQYWTQSEYGDEDRYVYRETMRQTWEDFYFNAENLRKVIQLNTDEETKNAAAAYGPNEYQIAVARILLSWTFDMMANTWGDIPYYSYGNEDPSFQALELANTDEEILQPAYADQAVIYADILNELKEAAEQIGTDPQESIEGDNLYGGDMSKWVKFANSLRLRIALKVMAVDPALANQHISEISAGEVFENDNESAVFVYETSDGNASPYYRAYNVDNRSDFAMAYSFVQLLKGENVVDTLGADLTTNPFAGIVDPRLDIFAQQNSDGVYIGMPVVENSSEAATINWESLPGDAIINTPDFGQPIITYAEVMFIMSELNGWDQTYYEAGIRGSMERWGIAASEIDDYIAAVPAASMETVLTQKYIALYMDPHTAWTEYRRTGYPQTLVSPNSAFTINVPVRGITKNFIFEPLIPTDDLPKRMRYPQYEQTLNGDNWAEAVADYEDGDAITSKLWWDVN